MNINILKQPQIATKDRSHLFVFLHKRNHGWKTHYYTLLIACVKIFKEKHIITNKTERQNYYQQQLEYILK